MDVEIEAKFIEINPTKVRKQLLKSGASLIQNELLMRRRVYEHPTNKQNDWFRVRDEGSKITMSYKQLTDRTITGTKEITFTVPDFDQACRFLESAGLRFVSYQETKRELWKLGNVEITIDTWPWVPPFVEIEGPTEEEVKDTAELLGFDYGSALHGSVENVYTRYYEVTEEEVCDWPEITFALEPTFLKGKIKQ